MPLRPLGWGGPWAAAGDSGPGFLCLCVWRGRKGLLLDLLTLVWVSVLEHFRGRGGARWSWEFAEVSEVRRRPANGGGGLRGCVLEPRGSVPAVASFSSPATHTPPHVAEVPRQTRLLWVLDLSPPEDPAMSWDPFRRPTTACCHSRLPL